MARREGTRVGGFDRRLGRGEALAPETYIPYGSSESRREHTSGVWPGRLRLPRVGSQGSVDVCVCRGTFHLTRHHKPLSCVSTMQAVTPNGSACHEQVNSENR